MANADGVMENFHYFIMIHKEVVCTSATNVGVVFGSVGRLIDILQHIGD